MSFVEEDHWENARPFLETHAETFGQLSGGNQAHQLPVPKPLPHELAAARGDRTIVLALHYPPPGSPGYLTSTGDATDATTRALASAVNKAFQEHHLRFAQTFDVIVDLYDGPHDFKVDGRAFNFETHFFDKLSPEEQQAWWETKVGTLVGIIVDEIVQRGRKGADVLAMGVLPRKWWPELLAAAVPLAREQARTILGLTYLPPYDIAYPSTSGGQLPPLTRDEETGRAPSCGDKEIQHPCGAFSFMSVDHRALPQPHAKVRRLLRGGAPAGAGGRKGAIPGISSTRHRLVYPWPPRRRRARAGSRGSCPTSSTGRRPRRRRRR